jgi:hypothetical protein
VRLSIAGPHRRRTLLPRTNSAPKMSRKLIPMAIVYDFDGTLAPGNIQENSFIPEIGMKKASFWQQNKDRAKKHEADEVLSYMTFMLERASANDVPVRRQGLINRFVPHEDRLMSAISSLSVTVRRISPVCGWSEIRAVIQSRPTQVIIRFFVRMIVMVVFLSEMLTASAMQGYEGELEKGRISHVIGRCDGIDSLRAKQRLRPGLQAISSSLSPTEASERRPIEVPIDCPHAFTGAFRMPNEPRCNRPF